MTEDTQPRNEGDLILVPRSASRAMIEECFDTDGWDSDDYAIQETAYRRWIKAAIIHGHSPSTAAEQAYGMLWFDPSPSGYAKEALRILRAGIGSNGAIRGVQYATAQETPSSPFGPGHPDFKVRMMALHDQTMAVLKGED